MIIDTNISCLNKGAYLKARGVDAVGRYYRKSTHADWRISAGEAKELSKLDIRLFMVFEDYGKAVDLVLTEEQGAADAASALMQADAIGQPDGSAIYFAVEGLPSGYKTADLPRIRSYFAGVRQALRGRYSIGVYGDGVVCKTMLEERICRYTWLAAASTSFEGTCAFFGGKRPSWNLAQVPPLDLDWGGLSVDFNISNPSLNGGDFGAFVVPT